MILKNKYEDLESAFTSISSQSESSNGRVEDHEYIEDKHFKYFKIIRTLGTGSSSKVVLGINVHNNEKVAIKIVHRKNNNNNNNNDYNNDDNKSSIRIYREVIMSSLLNHPYIVRLKDFFYSNSYFFLIFEYVRGKQLYEVIVNDGELDEKEARRYFRQLISAIDYIHKNAIVHRDLKIENVLVDEFGNIKLIDFGLSNFYDNKLLLNTFCGSLYFAAPELLLGNRYCGPEIDIWSLGVILYVILNGCVPFDDKDVVSLQEKIKEGKFEYKSNISEEVKYLIGNMLQPDSSSRFTLDQIINSIWINEGYESEVDNYMIKRYPLKNINHNHLEVISTAVSFQFKNLKREVLKYHDICNKEDGSLEEKYWSKRPSISLYYLLLENLEDENENIDNNYNIDRPEIINRFVNYVISKEKASPCSKYYKQTVFKTAPVIEGESSTSSNKLMDYPRIRNTYVKGFFKGIKVKHIGTPNALKKTLLDIFNKNRIRYEISEKYFFCSLVDREIECTFRISMFFNIILSEYYVGIHFLSGDRELYHEIHEEINECIKERQIV